MNSDNFSVTAINHKPHWRPWRPYEGVLFPSCMVSLLTNKRSSWTQAVLMHGSGTVITCTRSLLCHSGVLHSFTPTVWETYESSRDEEDWDLDWVERSRKKRVPAYLLSKLRGALLLASPSLAFTSLTAPLAPFDIPSLCSATLQIPLSHLHSLKAQFHLTLSLSFFPIPFSFCYFK